MVLANNFFVFDQPNCGFFFLISKNAGLMGSRFNFSKVYTNTYINYLNKFSLIISLYYCTSSIILPFCHYFREKSNRR